MKTFTDIELAQLAIEEGFGVANSHDNIIRNIEGDVIWFESNPIPLMRKLLEKASKISFKEIHHTIGVYLDGSRGPNNGVRHADLEEHINYNRAFRPGRALFVDGKCVHPGYLSVEMIEEIEQEFVKNPINMSICTAPYY